MTDRSIVKPILHSKLSQKYKFGIPKHTCKIYIKYILIHVKYITSQNGDQLASALRHN